jgi:hypothetical protein
MIWWFGLVFVPIYGIAKAYSFCYNAIILKYHEKCLDCLESHLFDLKISKTH